MTYNKLASVICEVVEYLGSHLGFVVVVHGCSIVQGITKSGWICKSIFVLSFLMTFQFEVWSGSLFAGLYRSVHTSNDRYQ